MDRVLVGNGDVLRDGWAIPERPAVAQRMLDCMLTVCAVSRGCARRRDSPSFGGVAYCRRVGPISSLFGGLLDARSFQTGVERVPRRLGSFRPERRECTGTETEGCAARRRKTTPATTSTAWGCDGIEGVFGSVRGAVATKSLGKGVPTERVRVAMRGARRGEGELAVAETEEMSASSNRWGASG